jgi:hypothetical protein
VKKLPLFTPRQTLFYHQHPSTRKTTTTTPGFSRARPYPFLVNPLSNVPTWPRPPPVNKRMTPICRSQGIARSPQDSRPFTVPSSNVTMTPRGWLAITRACCYSASTTSTEPSPLRHRLRVLAIPRPPLDSIKKRGQRVLQTGERRRTFSPLQRSTSQATLHFTLLLRLGTVSLSHSL